MWGGKMTLQDFEKKLSEQELEFNKKIDLMKSDYTKTLEKITLNKNELELLEATDKCDCGHMAKNHKIANPDELEKGSTKLKTKCRFCNCKEMSF